MSCFVCWSKLHKNKSGTFQFLPKNHVNIWRKFKLFHCSRQFISSLNASRWFGSVKSNRSTTDVPYSIPANWFSLLAINCPKVGQALPNIIGQIRDFSRSDNNRFWVGNWNQIRKNSYLGPIWPTLGPNLKSLPLGFKL